MPAALPSHYSPEEYLALEASSNTKHEYLTSSPTLAFGHRLRGKEGDSYGATHEKPHA